LIDGIDTICNWLKAGSGFLFIHGGCGCGKTYLSCAIKHKFNIENIKCDLFFSSDIVLKLKESFQNKNDDEKETEFDIIKKCSPSPREEKYDFFAIFDDFGAQKLSEYAIESWYHIVDRRYRNNNKTIFTSNLTLKDISLFMSDRIASRIASGIIFEMSGTDKRLIK
jgi:DNA replication protein DnaC